MPYTFNPFTGKLDYYVAGGTGPQGPTGPMGMMGLDGADGEDGIPGPAGQAGASGAPGAPGSTGPQGPMGAILFLDADAGEDGPPGPPGAQGPAGTGGGGTTGIAVVNFGSSGSLDASVTVTGQAAVTGSSAIMAAVLGASGDDTVWVDQIDAYVGNIVAGTGFTIWAKPQIGKAFGSFNVAWRY